MAERELKIKYGPRSKADSPFAAKARFLQSWYRAEVLEQNEYGFGPEANSKTRYGNILIDGQKNGLNFLSPDIFEYVKSRIQFLKNGETIKEYRIFNNMLSSQPMCFNLFYPLKALFERDDKAATNILRNCFPELKIKQLLAVEIEYLPYPVHEYLDDRTAFDAMIVYKTDLNERNILAIETKYVEALGNNPSSKLSKQIELVKNSPLFSSLGKMEVEKGFGQLGRNFLLAEKFKIENRLDKAFAVTISPVGNGSSKAEIEQFHSMMNDDFKNRLFYHPLENVVNSIKETSPKSMKNWIESFNTRYLAFPKIENIYKDYLLS
jgi:hypothetical protein